MENVLLVVHLIIAVAMILLILIQRNAQDGGGLMGGGGTMGGLFTARGSANALTRTTAILAAAFIATSLLLTILANHGTPRAASLINQIAPLPAQEAPATNPANGNAAGSTTPQAEKPVEGAAAPESRIAPVNPAVTVPNPAPEKPVPALPQVPMGK